jgi:ABC-type transport system involved in multi-copper enzyme maturation permease subunit
LFAKPVERYEFVLGKFLGCVVLLAVNLCVIGLIVSMLLYRENPQLTRALLLDLATYWVSYTSLIALSISLTLVLPMTVAALLSLGVYFLGAVYGVGLQVAQTEQLHPVWRGLGRLVYGFGRVASPRINWLNTDRPALAVIGHSQAQAVAYVLAYSIVVLLLGAIAFSRREM